MFSPSYPEINNPFKILIPSQIRPQLFISVRVSLILLLIWTLSLVSSSYSSPLKPFTSEKRKEIRNITAMKVHPMPRKRNITIGYNSNSRNSHENQNFLNNKKLRRLPHIFSRILELPFRSDADVSIEEKPDCFRFIAETDGMSDEVRAHAVEIHPGVIKIVVRESESLEMTLDELELDMWRFRLPETTRPELASAVFVDGELIVTVPKGNERENSEDGEGGDVWGDGMGGRLVLVRSYDIFCHIWLHLTWLFLFLRSPFP